MEVIEVAAAAAAVVAVVGVTPTRCRKVAGIYKLKGLLPRVDLPNNVVHACFKVCHTERT